MKRTIKGVEYDTKRDEDLANYDDDDSGNQENLYRTEEGRFYLHCQQLQFRQGGVWRDAAMDGTTFALPDGSVRFVGTIRPLSKGEAVEWFVETHAPECLKNMVRITFLPIAHPHSLS